MLDRAADLLARYRSLGLKPPPWAYPLAPSIPFIGRAYGREGGLLVYGSAENLAHYERKPETIPDFLKDERVHNRRRASFDQGREGFFPRVHMAPVSDGSLLLAGRYYLWRKGESPPEDAWEFIESIAVDNFCKFAVSGSKNRDHVGDLGKVSSSLPYVAADLQVLRPAAVILPRSIWKHLSVQEVFREVVPAAEILPLPQFNPQVVNTHLRKHAVRAEELGQELRGTVLQSWIAQMRRYAAGTPYRFLVEMDVGMQETRR